MKILPYTRRAGITLVELLIALTVGGLTIAVVLSGALSMQRCFVATESFASAKKEQMRLSDFLAMDFRRALTVTPGADGTTIATVKMPAYYDEAGQPRTPKITRYVHSYGEPGQVATVVYRMSGNQVFRQEGDEEPLEIASGIEDFDIAIDDRGHLVTTRITFLPKFKRSGLDTASARVGTTLVSTVALRHPQKKNP